MRWRTADSAGLGLVVAANPALLASALRPGSVAQPDSADGVAYATLARGLLDTGRLWIDGWGHVDAGLILPPLLPGLEAIVGAGSERWLERAPAISTVALVVSAVLVFLLLRRHVPPLLAAVAAALPPLVAPLFVFGRAPLTESLFIATIALAILALDRAIHRPTRSNAAWLGAACALCLLTRLAGLFVSGFCIAWLGFALWRTHRARGIWLRATLVATGGLLLVYGPYAAALYAQTGRHPLTQHFRKGEYAVTSEDPAVLGEIAAIRARIDPDDYRTLYAARRQMRRLLPDASEMYIRLLPAPEVAADPGVTERVRGLIRQPSRYLTQLWNNFRHVGNATGAAFLGLLGLTLATGAWRSVRGGEVRRTACGAFVLAYLAPISLLTDLIPRYAVVVVPMAAAHVALELEALARRLPPLRQGARSAVATACVLGLSWIGARWPDPATLEPGLGAERDAVAGPAAQVASGETLLAPHPVDAYLLGAGWRMLPDDRLEQVVRYARRTGADWLWVSQTPRNRDQVRRYRHRWYVHPALIPRAAEDAGLARCCGTGPRGKHVLYRVRRDDPMAARP